MFFIDWAREYIVAKVSQLLPRPKNWPELESRRNFRLFRRLRQIGDQIGAIARIGHPGIGHAIARDQGLWIGQEHIQRLRRPDDPAALERQWK
jgi:hypothetical protein